MNCSFILISYYLNKSVYTLPNKPHKGLKKKMFYALNNFQLYVKKALKYIQLSLFVFFNFF